MFIRNLNQFRRDSKVPGMRGRAAKKFLKSNIGILLTQSGIATTKTLRTLAKVSVTRSAGSAAALFLAELFSGLFGNVHGIRELVSYLRWPYYGLEISPLTSVIRQLLDGVLRSYSLIDEWDDEKAWRTATQTSYAFAIFCGIPVVGAYGMYRIVEGLMPEETRRRPRGRTTRRGGSRGRTSRGRTTRRGK